MAGEMSYESDVTEVDVRVAFRWMNVSLSIAGVEQC